MSTLAEVIARLEAAPQALVLEHGFGRPTSYRGYYEQLAFVPAANVTVASMLAHARAALGTTFEGYKGGEYVMYGETECWLSDWGESSGKRLEIDALLAGPEIASLRAERAGADEELKRHGAALARVTRERDEAGALLSIEIRTSRALHRGLLAAENERDAARAESERLTRERDTLRRGFEASEKIREQLRSELDVIVAESERRGEALREALEAIALAREAIVLAREKVTSGHALTGPNTWLAAHLARVLKHLAASGMATHSQEVAHAGSRTGGVREVPEVRGRQERGREEAAGVGIAADEDPERVDDRGEGSAAAVGAGGLASPPAPAAEACGRCAGTGEGGKTYLGPHPCPDCAGTGKRGAP